MDGSDLGSRLLRAVADAHADGLDAEAALRVATLELIDRVRRDEQD